ncbi:MAG: hypothetical protein Q4E55_03250 [Bacteroidales bacterium]|nr:hypothetical protein [Bacteroidales bacterium]
MLKKSIVVVALLVVVAQGALAQPKVVSPLQFGLDEATTGEERFEVLMRTHEAAVRERMGVSYEGISSIYIDVPADAKSIPLTDFTDFAGVALHVRNTQANLTLFRLTQAATDMTITGREIDGGHLGRHKELADGLYLVDVADETLWVENRDGFTYGAIRHDMLVVSDGKALNRPVASYSTPASKPKAAYCAVTPHEKVFRNLTFLRDAASTKKTYLVGIDHQYNVCLSNIVVNTPADDELYGDACIQLNYCAKVLLDRISVNGTYSQKGQYGYGINLNTIYDLTVSRMYARAKWGVFGTNNLNKVLLTDCDINRFDIHCYGRDVASERCHFSLLYNQFSSVFGTVSFTDCTFTDFRPVLFEYSYNAYTRFKLSFVNCRFNVTHSQNYIIYGGDALRHEVRNSRPELSRKFLPDISFRNFVVNVPEGVDEVLVYKFHQPAAETIPVDVSGIRVVSNHEVRIRPSN